MEPFPLIRWRQFRFALLHFPESFSPRLNDTFMLWLPPWAATYLITTHLKPPINPRKKQPLDISCPLVSRRWEHVQFISHVTNWFGVTNESLDGCSQRPPEDLCWWVLEWNDSFLTGLTPFVDLDAEDLRVDVRLLTRDTQRSANLHSATGCFTHAHMQINREECW